MRLVRMLLIFLFFPADAGRLFGKILQKHLHSAQKCCIIIMYIDFVAITQMRKEEKM